MKESDLYLPVKRYLEAQGYEVKAEVTDCDVVAVRGQEAPVIVELKRSLNLDVVLQAVDRLALAPAVYVGVPKRCSALKRRRRALTKLLRMLGMGLLVVDSATGQVEPLLDPGKYQPRRSNYRQQRLLGEFQKRVGDPNLGGMEKRQGIMTSYRQRALRLGRFLLDHGPTRAVEIARCLDEPQARVIAYRDVYGWFERIDRGVYQVSPRGLREIPQWEQQLADD